MGVKTFDNSLKHFQPLVGERVPNHSSESLVIELPNKKPETRISMTIEPGQCSFFIPESVVEEIEQGQEKRLRIIIPSRLTLKIVYNVYLKGGLQYGLTFCGYYAFPNDTHPKIIMRSVVFADGDIIYQLRRDVLQERNCKAIAITFHWISGKILAEIRTLINGIAWSISGLVSSYLAIAKTTNIALPSMTETGLSGMISFGLIILVTIGWILTENIRSWLIRQWQKLSQGNLDVAKFLRPSKREWINWIVLLLTTVLLIIAVFTTESWGGVVLSLLLIPFLKVSFQHYLLPIAAHFLLQWLFSQNAFGRQFKTLLNKFL